MIASTHSTRESNGEYIPSETAPALQPNRVDDPQCHGIRPETDQRAQARQTQNFRLRFAGQSPTQADTQNTGIGGAKATILWPGLRGRCCPDSHGSRKTRWLF